MTHIPATRPGPEWLALSEAARLLRKSRQYVNDLRRWHRVDVTAANGIWWYSRASLEMYAREHAKLAAAERAFKIATRRAS